MSRQVYFKVERVNKKAQSIKSSAQEEVKQQSASMKSITEQLTAIPSQRFPCKVARNKQPPIELKKGQRFPQAIVEVLKNYAKQGTASTLNREFIQIDLQNGGIPFDITTNEHHWQMVKEKIKKLRSRLHYSDAFFLQREKEEMMAHEESSIDWASECKSTDSEKESGTDEEIIVPKKRKFVAPYPQPFFRNLRKGPHAKDILPVNRDERMLDPQQYDTGCAYVGRLFDEDFDDPRQFFASQHTKVQDIDAAQNIRQKKRQQKLREKLLRLSDKEDTPHVPRYKHQDENALKMFEIQFKHVEKVDKTLASKIRDKILALGDWYKTEMYQRMHDKWFQTSRKLKELKKELDSVEDLKKQHQKEIDELIEQQEQLRNEVRTAKADARSHLKVSIECLKETKENKKKIQDLEDLNRQYAKEIESSQLHQRATDGAIRTLYERDVLRSNKLTPFEPHMFWCRESRSFSAKYFTWRLISNPVSFYNEMVQYYQITIDFLEQSDTIKLAILMDINHLLKSIYTGRDMLKEHGGLSGAETMDRCNDDPDQVPNDWSFKRNRNMYLYNYVDKILPIPYTIQDWMDQNEQDPFCKEAKDAIDYNKAYTSVLFGKVTEESIKNLSIQDEFDHLPKLPKANFEGGFCYSMRLCKTEFACSMYKEAFEQNAMLSEKVNNLESIINQQQQRITNDANAIAILSRDISNAWMQNAQQVQRVQDLEQRLDQANDDYMALDVQMIRQSEQYDILNRQLRRIAGLSPVELNEKLGSETLTTPQTCALFSCGIEEHPIGTPYFNSCSCSGSTFVCQLCAYTHIQKNPTCPVCRTPIAKLQDQVPTEVQQESAQQEQPNESQVSQGPVQLIELASDEEGTGDQNSQQQN